MFAERSRARQASGRLTGRVVVCLVVFLLAGAWCVALSADGGPVIAPQVADLYTIVRNGGFEEGGDVPAWWSRYPPKDEGGNRHLRDTSVAHSGHASALIWSKTPHQPGKAGFQWNKYGLPVEGGSTLIVSYWFKTDGDSPIGTGLHFYARDGSHVGFSRVPVTGPARDWVYVRGEVDVPAEAVKAGFALYAQDLARTWYDDVALLATPRCKAVRGTPTIDGDLSDACWGQAQALGPFVLHTGQGLASAQTQAWLAYDDENLYVAFRCPFPTGSKLKADAVRHDGKTWLDDSVEVFLDPWARKRRDYYQLCINCRGVLRDSHKTQTVWESGARVRTRIARDHWTAEVAIPYEHLGIDLTVGRQWGVNLVRNDRVRGEVTTWSLGGFHKPGRFGTVELAPDLGRYYRASLIDLVAAEQRREEGLRGEIEACGLPAEALAKVNQLLAQAEERIGLLRAIGGGRAELPAGGWEKVRQDLAQARELLGQARQAAVDALFAAQAGGEEGVGFRLALASSLQKVRRSGPPGEGLLTRTVRL
ncbi:MAG: hypothetical protein J7M26_02250, partial [Armatimonadetes bacterium]|nr:hypothetical protein [Armatimonadota bacterium]